MSYQTGTATDIDDLLAKLSIFAVANGWTENKVVAGSGDGASSEMYLSKGVTFVIFAPELLTGGNRFYHGTSQVLDQPNMQTYVATGFDGGAAAAAQPGTSLNMRTNWLLPNFTAYHFFTDSSEEYLHIAIEVIANEFRHIHVGLLDKVGAYDGGQYNCGTQADQSFLRIDDPANFQHSYPWTKSGNGAGENQLLRVNIDGQAWKNTAAIDNTSAWTPGLRFQNQGDLLDVFMDMRTPSNRSAQPNTFNSTVVLFPIPVYISRSATQRAPVGKPFDIRVCNIKNIAPSSEISFGGDDWLIFPFVEKKAPDLRDDLPNSGWLAWAYKKIP